MIPKEKAKYLIDKFKHLGFDRDGFSNRIPKECAIICVNELIEDNEPKGTFLKYWEEVKQEIENF